MDYTEANKKVCVSIDWQQVDNALTIILMGGVNRVDVNKNLIVYKCGKDVIRIDIKHLTD